MCGVEDRVLLLGGVGVAAWVFAVLLAAGVTFIALPAVWCANARQVLGYEQEAKPYLTRCVLVQCGQVSVVLIVIAMRWAFYLEPLPAQEILLVCEG